MFLFHFSVPDPTVRGNVCYSNLQLINQWPNGATPTTINFNSTDPYYDIILPERVELIDNNQQNTNTQQVEIVCPISREDGTRQRRDIYDDYILMLPEGVTRALDHNQQNTQQLEEAIPISMGDETSYTYTEENIYEIVPSENGEGERAETLDLERVPG